MRACTWCFCLWNIYTNVGHISLYLCEVQRFWFRQYGTWCYHLLNIYYTISPAGSGSYSWASEALPDKTVSNEIATHSTWRRIFIPFREADCLECYNSFERSNWKSDIYCKSRYFIWLLQINFLKCNRDWCTLRMLLTESCIYKCLCNTLPLWE